jgi:hypothetical protein
MATHLEAVSDGSCRACSDRRIHGIGSYSWSAEEVDLCGVEAQEGDGVVSDLGWMREAAGLTLQAGTVLTQRNINFPRLRF